MATVRRMTTPRRAATPSRGSRGGDRFLLGVRDGIVTLGACAIAMAAVLGIASVASTDLVGGGAGPALARLFAAALAISGGFAVLLGGLISPEPVSVAGAWLPLAAGAASGLVEAAMFVATASVWLLVLVPLGTAAAVAAVQVRQSLRPRTRAERRRR